MQTELLSSVEINPPQEADFSVIWLHGLGADGHDFEAIVPELHLPAALNVRFVFPHAPIRPVTLNAGASMRAWYDIVALDRRTNEDSAGIQASAALLRNLIVHEEARGIPSSHILVAGFSQGAAMALYTGLRYPKKLAGIMALSSYLPLKNTFTTEAHVANQETPLFMAAGLHDPIVQYAWSSETKDVLTALNYPIQWHSYPMEHSICAQEIQDISQWLQHIFSHALAR